MKNKVLIVQNKQIVMFFGECVDWIDESFK